jgi:hypothetical protein
MKEFLQANWLVLIALVLFVAFDIYLVVTKQWGKLRAQAYALMLTAERVFGEGEGKKKFDAVFEKIYFYIIPSWLRLFVSPIGMQKITLITEQ